MATQVTTNAGAADQLNQAANDLGTAIATTVAPAHAEAIKGLAQEEPAVFSAVMTLIHTLRKPKKPSNQ